MPLMGNPSLARVLYGPSMTFANLAATAPSSAVSSLQATEVVNMTQVVKQQKADQFALDNEIRYIVLLGFAGILGACMILSQPRFLARVYASMPHRERNQAVGGGDLRDGWLLRRKGRPHPGSVKSSRWTISKTDNEGSGPLVDSHTRSQQLQPPPHLNLALSFLPFSSALLVSPFAKLPRIARSYMTLTQLLLILSFVALLAFTLIYKSDLSPSTRTKGSGQNFQRAGSVATALIPLTIALGVRGNVIGLCVGEGYERLKIFHKVIGRLLFVAVIVHVVGFYVKNGVTLLGLQQFIVWGYISFIGILVMVVTSLPVIRNVYYGVFRVCHFVGMIAVLLGLAFHRDECIPYSVAGVCIYTVSIFCSLSKTRLATATIEALPEASTTVVTIPSLRSGWRAGQHVRLRVPAFGLPHGLESHPFAIASSPNGEGMVLMCKKAGDWTDRLFRHASGSSFQSDERRRKITVILEGPYGGLGNTLIPSFSSVLLVAGGSGITSALGHAHDLITRAPTALMATLIDLVNDAKDWELTCNSRRGTGQGFGQDATALRVHIYVTRCPISSPITLLAPASPFDDDRNTGIQHKGLSESGQSLESLVNSEERLECEKDRNRWRSSILPSTTVPSSLICEPSTGAVPTLSGISVYPLRPNFSSILSNTVHETILRHIKKATRPSGICVTACGPHEMVQGVRDAVRLFDSSKKWEVGGIELEEERFGW
ncbi:hypothetical protein IAR55_003334 [Kwoniella newhampshirensis]|uniref:ferric-chelate reductase (NADPH) n=1 Tax=Kwoniella newhampshirensis TaxID=1651941 RepID=A0AAW0YM86_9TREE